MTDVKLSPSAGDETKVRDGLRRLLEGGAMTTTNVQRYLDPDKRYAQDRFDLLAPNPPAEITTADLLAVTLLDMTTPVGAVRKLLSSAHGGEGLLDDLLVAQRFPSTVDLWDASDEHLTTAHEAWRRIREIPGCGYVRAGKVLARKRPRLIPVWDSVVRSFYGAPDAVWATFREVLRDEDLRYDLEGLKPDGWPREMSLLRLIDIAAWMHSR